MTKTKGFGAWIRGAWERVKEWAGLTDHVVFPGETGPITTTAAMNVTVDLGETIMRIIKEAKRELRRRERNRALSIRKKKTQAKNWRKWGRK